MDLQRLRVGYVPISASLDEPGDRRRFVHYARTRGVAFEIADTRKDYDVVVLSERADLSVWRRYRGGRIVYDLIDSYLAIPRTSLKGQLRGLAKFVARQSRYPDLDYWRAVQRMCERADAVICTTERQRCDIAPYCRNVHVILDAHSMVTCAAKTVYRAGAPFRLVWEGLAQNLDSLLALGPVLRKLERRHAIALNIVTDPEYFRYLGRYGRRRSADRVAGICGSVKLHVWSEETMAPAVTACDLAVIPLALDDPFAAGKPENKLVLLWRMGMPTVTSASPAYKRTMSACGLDMSCTTEREWIDTLERYIKDESAREDAGRHGRTYAEKHYSEESMLAEWDAVFTSILG